MEQQMYKVQILSLIHIGYKRTGRAAWRTAKSVQGEKNPGDDRV